MKQTIIELKLSVSSKDTAIMLMALIQKTTEGRRDENTDGQLARILRENCNVVAATYRERKGND